MTDQEIKASVQKAEEALKTLLKKTLGSETPLRVAQPSEVGPEENPHVSEERVLLHAAEGDVQVALAPGWAPLLSEAMLGQPLEAGSEGTLDLLREFSSQAFGTIQSTLAAEGTELPTIQFASEGLVKPESTPDRSLLRISFEAEAEEETGETLRGYVLLPDPRQSASGGGEEGDREDQSASTDRASAQRGASPHSPSDPESKAGAQAGDVPRTESPGGGSRGSADSTSSRSAEAGSANASKGDEVEVAPASFQDLGSENLEGDGGARNNFELLAEVNLEVRVELGRRQLPLADVLKLTSGSVIELEKMVGEPLSVYANGRLIAEGEAVVIDEQFGVRITNLASDDKRDKAFF